MFVEQCLPSTYCVMSKIDSANLVLGEVISDLVRDISKFPHVQQVRAFSKYMDGRWIDFQILHNYETKWDELLPEETRNKIYDLVSNTNLEIREMTGVKFYFHPDYYFGKLPTIPEPEVNQVVADSQVFLGDKHDN